MAFNKKDNTIKIEKEFKYKFQSNLWNIFQTVLWLSILIYVSLIMNITKTILILSILFILLFSIYFAFLIIKSLSKITFTDKEVIRTNLINKNIIKWKDISEVKLHYYSTRRDKEKGWMVLLLFNNKKKIAIHSSIPDFDKILEEIASKTYSYNYLFNYYTEKNFKAMGINLYNKDK